MHRADLVEQVARTLDLSKRQAREQVDATLAAIADALTRGEEVRVTGFGTFALVFRPAREGVIHGRVFTAPARSTVRFRAAKQLAKQLPAARA